MALISRALRRADGVGKGGGEAGEGRRQKADHPAQARAGAATGTPGRRRQRGASCFLPLSQRLGHRLRRRHHHPPSGPSRRRSRRPAASRRKPSPPRRRFRSPFQGAFPAPSTSERPEAPTPDSTWLPESASCVACVPPCWPLRPVPSDVERGEGGGNLARASRRSRYVTRRLGPCEGGEAGARPDPGQARRDLAAPSLPSPPLPLLWEREVAGSSR